MGCGASTMAHSPVALDLGRPGQALKPMPLEPERELEQLVNNVNLDKESLGWFAPQVGEERAQWELCFTFDAERAGHGAVYFGCGGPLAEAGEQDGSELDTFMRLCESNGEISPAVRWQFGPGHEQACSEPLSVQLVQLLGALNNRPEPALSGDEIVALTRQESAAAAAPAAAESRRPPLGSASGSLQMEMLSTDELENGEWVLEEAEDEESSGDDDDGDGAMQSAASIMRSLPVPEFAPDIQSQPPPVERSRAQPIQQQALQPRRTVAPAPHPALGSAPVPLHVGAVICTVVIHLECVDEYNDKQSQTTVLLVEVPARTSNTAANKAAAAAAGAADAVVPRAPLIHSAKQVLLIGGRVFQMLDVFGLDTSVDITDGEASPPGYSPSPPKAPPRTRRTGSPVLKDDDIRGCEDATPPPAPRRPLSVLDQNVDLASSGRLLGLKPGGEKSSVSSIVSASSASSVASLSNVSLTHNGAPCLICLTEPKDCVLLPCRHLCCCAGCVQGLYDSTMITSPAPRQISHISQLSSPLNRQSGGQSSNASQQQSIRIQCKPLSCPICRSRIDDVLQLPI